jgi:hypothetical protein
MFKFVEGLKIKGHVVTPVLYLLVLVIGGDFLIANKSTSLRFA